MLNVVRKVIMPKSELNPYNLSFKGSSKLSEKLFLEDYFARSSKQIKLCIILSLVVYAAFGIIDIYAVPALRSIFWIIRYAVYCPMAVGMLAYSYSTHFKKHFQPALSIFAIIASIGTLIINSLASSNGFYSYRYAVFFTLIFIYNLARLRFVYASLTGWAVQILYNCLTLLVKNTPFPEFLDVNILLFSINIFGMMSCYFLEYYERKNYYLVSLVNEKKEKAENTNQELEEKFRITFENAPVGICNTSLDGRFLSANNEFCNILGYNQDELQKITFGDITYPEDLNSSLDIKTKLTDENIGSVRIEKRYVRKNGEIVWADLTVMLMRDSVGQPSYYISVIQDITDRKKTESEIIYLSYHDKLTGLYNRRFYEEEIQRLDIESSLPISIVIGDVNGLKLINDAFGHDKGDELLQKAAAAIRSVCRTEDIVARWGGDEFVILLPGTSSEEAEEIVGKIKAVYSNEYVSSIGMSISFGWETKNKTGEDILKVLKSAEDYMYKHKLIENEGIKGNTISTIVKTLHEKNPREEQHSKRVSEICQSIGEALGISEIQVKQLKVAGLLHDIGKIAIDENILNKPGKLSVNEKNEIRRHPDIGARILGSSFEMLELAGYILAHHERWDGTGYPKGLIGEEIPMVARIIALADSYDAMTSERPYRSILSDDEVFMEIRKNAGVQFDPDIAKVFIEKILNKPWDLTQVKGAK